MNEIELTPKQIVAELINTSSARAKPKSVAIALRNRWRRKRLSEDMQNEIIPKNILLIGPTGVGKTEIARRPAPSGRRAVYQSRSDEIYGSRLCRP